MKPNRTTELLAAILALILCALLWWMVQGLQRPPQPTERPVAHVLWLEGMNR